MRVFFLLRFRSAKKLPLPGASCAAPAGEVFCRYFKLTSYLAVISFVPGPMMLQVSSTVSLSPGFTPLSWTLSE